MQIFADPNLSFVLETARKMGVELYLVGGYVRHLLMMRTCTDLDFACAVDPKNLVQTLSEKLKRPMIVLEEERQIYRLFLSGKMQLDFARFKGSTLEADLAARDFTVNAMALKLQQNAGEISGELYDPQQGQKDLQQKIIRQVSSKIYEDDPLRMLRAHRIAAQLNFAIAEETLQNIIVHASKITTVAAERVREELLLMLDTPNVYERVLQLDRCGLLTQIFPEMEPNRTCALDYYPGKGVWGHSMDGFKCLEWIFENIDAEFGQDAEKIETCIFGAGEDTEGHARSTLMKLAIFLHDIGKAPTAKHINGRLHFYEHQNVGARITQKIAQRLKFSSKATAFLSEMVASHMRPGSMAFAQNLTDRARFRFFRDLEEDAIPMLLVSLADRYSYIPETLGKNTDTHELSTKDLIRWHYHKQLEQLKKKPKLIDGNQVMEQFGLSPGRAIGQILKDIEEAHVLGEIKTQEEAIIFIQKNIKNYQ